MNLSDRLNRAFNNLGVLYLGCIILVTSLCGILWNSQRDEIKLRNHIYSHIQKDFTSLLSGVKKFPLDYDEEDKVVHFIFNKDSNLVRWIGSELLPPDVEAANLLNYSSGRTFIRNNKKYFLENNETDSVLIVSLIVLEAKYRFENSFLPSYSFLGRYNSVKGLREKIGEITISLKKESIGFPIMDNDGKNAFYLSTDRIRPFIQWTQRLFSIGIIIGLVLIFLFLFYKIRFHSGLQRAVIVCTAALITLRAIFIYFGFPGDLIDSELFSPSLLAINSLNPSLGDFLINVFLLDLILVWIVKLSFRKITPFYQKVSRDKIKRKILFVAFLVILCAIQAGFYGFFLNITQNSKINIDFSRIYSLDFNSTLLFLALAGMIFGVFISSFPFLRYLFHYIRTSKIPFIPLIVGIGIGCFLMSMFIFQLEPRLAVGISITNILFLTLKSRIRSWEFIRMGFLNIILLLVIMSLLTSIATFEGLKKSQLISVGNLLNEAGLERDLKTETTFDKVSREIIEESRKINNGYSQGVSYSNITSRIFKDFMENAFQGYKVRIFFFGEDGTPIDRNLNQSPTFNIDPNEGIINKGEQTLSPYLVFIPGQDDKTEDSYLGLIDVQDPSLGKIYAQLELIPNNPSGGKVFPMLELEENLTNGLNYSPEKDYFAVYWKGVFHKKSGNKSFPTKLHNLGKHPVKKEIYSTQGDLFQTLYRTSREKTILVYSENIGFFHWLTLFSFIFYYYLVILILLTAPIWLILIMVKRESFFQLMIRTRIQIFLVIVTLFPLVTLVFLLGPKIEERSELNEKNELIEKSMRVRKALQEGVISLKETTIPQPFQISNFDKKMTQLGDDFGADINLYDERGIISRNTHSDALHYGTVSGFMDSESHIALKSGRASQIVTHEKIGKLEFLSAYLPIYDNDKSIISFLNITSRSNDRFNAERADLMAYLVDIYVLVFLGIGLLALFWTNSILQPLNILRGKMERTRLGKQNEPIEWKNKDEIGLILDSYNKMLGKLAESEKQLSESQRKQAWKLMARQVAHEIKNPLTPMKLSVQHLARSWDGGSEKLEKLFKKVSKTLLFQIDSLANIANSFSEFAQMPEARKNRLNLVEVVKGVFHLYEFTEGVEMELHLEKEEFWINSDREQLSRVFNNLIKNGIQALDKSEKKIKVSIAVSNGRATVKVKDNGKGIPESSRDKIFQPNFSTKTSGMGLGLAIVRQIIENAGGRIYFESVLNEGTTFIVELPEEP